MRILVLAITLLLVQVTSQTPPTATGNVVRGRLVQVQTGEGLADGEIILQPAAGPRGGAASMLRTTSGEDGRFVFNNVPAGQYNMVVLQEGFLGEGPPPNASTLTLSAQRAIAIANGTPGVEIVIPLYRGAVIAGRVLGADGTPAVRAHIRATVLTLQYGLPFPRVSGDTETNDRGEYRLYWMQPGEYFIQAAPEQTVSRVNAGVLTFYPDVLTNSAAKGVAVRAGDVVTGIDIRLRSQESAPKTYTVSGQVLSTLTSVDNPTGTPKPASGGVSYFAEDLLDEAGQRSIGDSNIATGRFEASVIPGSYVLYARIPNSQGSPQRGGGNTIAWGRTSFVVRNANIENLSVVVHPSVDVTGSIKLPPGEALSKDLRIGLDPDDTSLRIVNYQAIIDRSVAPNADGSFTIPKVAEADYAVRLTGAPSNFYIADLRQGSASIFGAGVHIGDRPPASIEVTVAADGGSIQGTVLGDDGNPVAGAIATLLFVDPSGQKNVIYATSAVDAQSKFTINGVRPGEYTMFASQNISPRAFLNVEFFRKNQPLGKAVKVTPSSRNEIQLTNISKR